jgi:hypothetical protein
MLKKIFGSLIKVVSAIFLIYICLNAIQLISFVSHNARGHKPFVADESIRLFYRPAISVYEYSHSQNKVVLLSEINLKE